MTTGLASGVANSLLSALFKATNYTAPAGSYVKLHTGDPGSAGTSSAATNTTRQAVTWGSPSGGAVANSADVTWSSVSTTETYTHYSVWSAATSGTLVCTGALTTARAVTAGDDFTIPTGDLTADFTPIAA